MTLDNHTLVVTVDKWSILDFGFESHYRLLRPEEDEEEQGVGKAANELIIIRVDGFIHYWLTLVSFLPDGK